MLEVSSWKDFLLIFIMTTRQKAEQRGTTWRFGVRRGTEVAAWCLQHLLTLYTELVIPVLQSGSGTGVHPGRRGEQNTCQHPKGDNCCASGVDFKQSVQELRLKYWGAHTGSDAHIVVRNLNHAGDFSWQIMAKSSVLNCNWSKELLGRWMQVYINKCLDNVVSALENLSYPTEWAVGKTQFNYSQL